MNVMIHTSCLLIHLFLRNIASETKIFFRTQQTWHISCYIYLLYRSQ